MTEQQPGGRNHYHRGRWRGVTRCYAEQSDSPGVNKKGQSVSPEAIWWKVVRRLHESSLYGCEAYRTWYGVFPGRSSTEMVRQVVHPLSYATKMTFKLPICYHHSSVLPVQRKLLWSRLANGVAPDVLSHVCNVFSFGGIFTGWAKVFPTYVEPAIGFMQRIVKGSNSWVWVTLIMQSDNGLPFTTRITSMCSGG